MNSLVSLLLAGTFSIAPVNEHVQSYLERYFATFPTRATEAGRHDFDALFEDLSPEKHRDWIAYNLEARAALEAALSRSDLAVDDRIDAKLLLRAVKRQIHQLSELKRAEHDPPFWTGILSSATVFLLVRDDLPEAATGFDRRAAFLRRLFERVSADRAETTDGFVGQYRRLVDESVAFVREREIIELPGPLTLIVDGSPGYLAGQSVGGVYPAGPYSPEADTLLFLPTPHESATVEEPAAFFRDFNEHFNVMITPHELIPGHYLQLKFAARQPRKVRAIFPDDVYVEGWGTFSERLMLDLGWGGPLDRLAHFKKQLKYIARTIVDNRVNAQGMTRDEVLRFVRDEALQDAQFASNMWFRAITSSPQLTTYYLGYRQIRGLYEDVRRAAGEDFVLRRFMDGMMALGPEPVGLYRERLLPTATAEPSSR